MDAMNFACELREATNAYLDVYEHPAELRRLMEIGLDFNVRFEEAQMDVIGLHEDGCFVWLAGWAPFERAVSMSVDGYVICSVKTYAEFGFEYNQRLIDHFGHGLMHFHCNRSDLAAEVARLRGLELFQFGGDTRDDILDIDRVGEMRAAVGEIPLQVGCSLATFGGMWSSLLRPVPATCESLTRCCLGALGRSRIHCRLAIGRVNAERDLLPVTEGNKSWTTSSRFTPPPGSSSSAGRRAAPDRRPTRPWAAGPPAR